MTMGEDISSRPYPSDQRHFETLNRAWIEKYSEMEPIYEMVLGTPEQYILSKGREILMAVSGDMVVGTVALRKVDAHTYEFTKMAVEEPYHGVGIGRILALEAIRVGAPKNATRLILYSSSRLSAALALYEKLGFSHIPVDGSYKRSESKDGAHRPLNELINEKS